VIRLAKYASWTGIVVQELAILILHFAVDPLVAYVTKTLTVVLEEAVRVIYAARAIASLVLPIRIVALESVVILLPVVIQPVSHVQPAPTAALEPVLRKINAA